MGATEAEEGGGGDSRVLIFGGSGAPGATFVLLSFTSAFGETTGGGTTTALKFALRFSKPAGGERGVPAADEEGERGRLSEVDDSPLSRGGAERGGGGSTRPMREGGR